VVTLGRVAPKPRLGVGQRGGGPRQIGFLREIADRGTGLDEAVTGIGLHQASGNAQQGGLAGAIAPNQADPITGGDG
jgi:hypothetical protein